MTDSTSDLDVVTGAFSYSGSVIAAELDARGRRVRTLTGHPHRAPADTPIEVHPLGFDDRAGLVDALRGAHTLYNTYWVRFGHGHVDHDEAVRNCRTLLRAAVDAGIQRIVHVSILHPSLDSPYPYFRGKAQVEQVLAELGEAEGLSHAIVRPAILFGGDGVLINNIAWLLRHLPVFAVGGRGDYRVRGIHVEDLARLCVDLGERSDTVTLDAVGPDRLTFRELVEAVRHAVHSRSPIIGVPAPVLMTLSGMLGFVLRDRVLTPEEYRSMAAGLADSDAPSTGTIRITDWLESHGDELGKRYANEIHRHFDAPAPGEPAAASAST
ncbi:MAG TPA: NAD(P)H-binding protein [Acidimicrobiales bacterium]|nr:NAD(P)H-binding protein [Acidimicrobiales bacterium]